MHKYFTEAECNSPALNSIIKQLNQTLSIQMAQAVALQNCLLAVDICLDSSDGVCILVWSST